MTIRTEEKTNLILTDLYRNQPVGVKDGGRERSNTLPGSSKPIAKWEARVTARAEKEFWYYRREGKRVSLEVQ